MEELKSMLIFKKYIVDEINFKRNANYDTTQKTRIEFSINKKIERKDNQMNVILTTKVFENCEEKNYPFEMTVVLTGYFEIENEAKNVNFEPNAVAILYPYIRSIVSTYTASANVSPLILPTINVNALFNKEN